MKAQHVNEIQFRPVALILETQHEVDAVFTLLNHSYISDSVGLTDQWEALSPFTTPNYADLHAKLQKCLRDYNK